MVVNDPLYARWVHALTQNSGRGPIRGEAWKTWLTTIPRYPDQFFQVMHVPTTGILDVGGFHKALGIRDCDVSYRTLVSLYPENEAIQVHDNLEFLMNDCNFRLLSLEGNDLIVYHRWRNDLDQKIGIRRRSIISDFDREGKPLVSLTLYTPFKADRPFELTTLLEDRHSGARRRIDDRRARSINGVSFTKREVQVLYWLTQNASSQEIASILSISRHTVDTIRRRLLVKTGSRRTPDLVARYAGMRL